MKFKALIDLESQMKPHKKDSNHHGQNTIEYILLLTGALTFLVIFLKPQGTFQNSLEKTYSDGTTTVDVVGGKLWTAFREQSGVPGSNSVFDDIIDSIQNSIE